jgi:hypothetical protein
MQSRALRAAEGILQTRLLMSEQLGGSIPTPFLTVLIFWISVLFRGFGLLVRFNATVTVALVGALSDAVDQTGYRERHPWHAESVKTGQHGRDQLAKNWPSIYTQERGADEPAEKPVQLERGASTGDHRTSSKAISGPFIIAQSCGSAQSRAGAERTNRAVDAAGVSRDARKWQWKEVSET